MTSEQDCQHLPFTPTTHQCTSPPSAAPDAAYHISGHTTTYHSELVDV